MKIRFVSIPLIIIVIISGCIAGSWTDKRVLTEDDIKNELQRLKTINSYPINKYINSKDYPKVIGNYSKNGLTIIERYFCSDVCPDYGRVSIIYANITSKEECKEVGGFDIIDPAWGGYVGCSPVNLE
jgi:hypothetical protein